MSKVDSYIKNIESERDFYRQEVETLNKLLKAQKTSLSPLNGCSPSSATSSQRKSTRSLKKSTSQSPSKKTSQTKTSKSPSPSRRSLKSQSVANLASTNDLELSKVIRERDELKVILDKFERHMSEIQANVKVLTNERDKINHLYEETRDELQRTRRELLKSPKAPNVSLAAQTILKRVENERDTALFELRAATNERDSLKERLRIATETSIQEKAKLEQQCEDLEHVLKTIDLEKNELYQQIDLFKAQMDDLENKFRSQNYSLTQTMQELNEQRNSATQIR
jgi:centrosomal protein CEP135